MDSTQPVTNQGVASWRGSGVVPREANDPIVFANKLLTETESRHSSFERGILAVLFGLAGAFLSKPATSRWKLSLKSTCQGHYPASQEKCCTYSSTTQKSNMSLKRTCLLLTPFQEAAQVVVKPRRGLMYLNTISISILLQARRECLIRITQPCLRSLCMDGLKRDLIALHTDGLILKGTRIVIPESLNLMFWNIYIMLIRVLGNASSEQRDQYPGQTSTVILKSWLRAIVHVISRSLCCLMMCRRIHAYFRLWRILDILLGLLILSLITTASSRW